MKQEIQEKIFQTGLVPLSVETLPLIKVGMYWYEGDEFSEKLIAERPIKSVVLLVKGQTIYGDKFEEESLTSDKFSLSAKESRVSVDELEKLIIPSIMLQAEIAASIAPVNSVLSALRKEMWQGTYLTISEYACCQFWTVFFPAGVRGSARGRSFYKVRRILERYVI